MAALAVFAIVGIIVGSNRYRDSAAERLSVQEEVADDGTAAAPFSREEAVAADPSPDQSAPDAGEVGGLASEGDATAGSESMEAAPALASGATSGEFTGVECGDACWLILADSDEHLLCWVCGPWMERSPGALVDVTWHEERLDLGGGTDTFKTIDSITER